MPFPPEFEEALFHLNVGRVGTGPGTHERPHKPLLLLSILDLIAQGGATPDRVPWSQTLRDRFTAYFSIVRAANDSNSPELPFYHLRDELEWSAFAKDSDGTTRPLPAPPSVAGAHAGTVWGSFGAPVDGYLTDPDARSMMRHLIVSRYFPHHREALSGLFAETRPAPENPPAPVVRDDESDPTPGRSAAFARIIREAYDYQCAACGLRIRLENDLTFIDAAHLIPFGQSFNDHPSNGIALCKNHHWAMDRSLLAPSTAFVWKVASHLDPRRSPGEAEILRLAGKALLLPRDEAYHPDPEALRWREDRVR